MRSLTHGLLLVVLAGAVVAHGCGPSDPAEKILAERARWTVSLQRWFPQEEDVFLSLRVQNPRGATLERLTVQVLFLDPGENVVEERWEALAVEDLRTGAAEDRSLIVPAPASGFDAVAVILVTAPDEAQRSRIVELNQS